MKRLLIALLGLAPIMVCAQTEDDVISADRPGMATGTCIMPKGKVQWEVGMAYDRSDEDGAALKSFTFCNSLFRYGITQNAEIRLELDGMHTNLEGDKTTGLAPVIVGTKVMLHEGEGVKPNVALLANFTLPLASKEFRPSDIAPSFYALVDHDVTDKLNLAYNAGLEWDGETSSPTTFAALCAGYAFNDKWGGFIESYNYFPKHGSASWNADLGVSWLASNKVQLDVAAAFNLNNIKKNYGISFGVAWAL